jgi:nitroreductase
MGRSVSPSSPAPGARTALTELILSRRSVRGDYLDRPVPEDVIDEILRCGLSAPSSKNARPWRLHVVTDRQLLSELAKSVATADGADTYVPSDPKTGKARADWSSTVVESAGTLAAVPLAIFIENLGAFSNGRETLAAVSSEHLRDSLVGYTFEVLGIGTAIMNMWLAAISLGAQASFMGDVCVAEKAIAARLGLERDLVGALAIGYSTSMPYQERLRPDVPDGCRVVRHRT